MRERKYITTACILGLSLMLFGCGTEFPELTDEQYNQTVEYAVGLLMKHSVNNQSRLVYVDANQVRKQREKEAAAQEELVAETIDTPPITEDVPVPDEPVSDDMGTLPEGEGSPEETVAEEPSGVTLSSDNAQEIEPDIYLSYQGYYVASTYPENAGSYVVNADKGKKLLVLIFDLYNSAATAQDVNMIPHKLNFQILLNGKNIGYSDVTFLPNDLSTFKGVIDGNAHESVVVLKQVDENAANGMESLGLIVTENGNSQTVNLK